MCQDFRIVKAPISSSFHLFSNFQFEFGALKVSPAEQSLISNSSTIINLYFGKRLNYGGLLKLILTSNLYRPYYFPAPNFLE